MEEFNKQFEKETNSEYAVVDSNILTKFNIEEHSSFGIEERNEV